MDLEQIKAVIYSCEGTVLRDDERRFFAESNPLGFIVFGRNCETPEQLYRLTSDLKDAVGWDCPILIDQEGGRVQRLKPPVWRGFPSMQMLGAIGARDLDEGVEQVDFLMAQMAEELRQAGISVNCAPVLDVLTPLTHDAIGDRAFGDDPALVAKMGKAVCRAFLQNGITPVMKHLPGHGRAVVDSHKDLPRLSESLDLLEQYDFAPFKALAQSDIGDEIWGMVAHIVYEGIDPDLPSSASKRVIDDIIRGTIGFDGLLLSDDLDMDALAMLGDVAARAHAVLQAGCDVALYCSGKLSDMQNIAETVPKLSVKAAERLQKSYESVKSRT